MNPDQTASKAAWYMNIVPEQEINQTTIVTQNRKRCNIGHAYAHRRADKDQAVYVSMPFLSMSRWCYFE